MLPQIQHELIEMDHQERIRIAEHERLINLVMESQQPRRPGIISRWMAALKTLATLRVNAPIPETKRPVALAHESGSFRIR
jgi:hypothetical protein